MHGGGRTYRRLRSVDDVMFRKMATGSPNANATGARLRELPLTRERIKAAIGV